MSYAAQMPRVLGGVMRNPDLRRVELAFVAFNAAEWGVWIAMLVYAYERGGATTAGVIALAQLVPASFFAPIAASLGDRYRPTQVLAVGYAGQAAAMGATAAVLLGGGPPPAAYALAAVAATAVTITRPAQAVLMPALARTPEELTAANVASGWIESVSVLTAPALAGVLLGVGGAGTVFTVMAAVAFSAAVLVRPVRGPGPAGGAPGLADALGGIRVVVDEPGPRALVWLLGVESLAIGALDVLYVVLAVGVLHHGGSRSAPPRSKGSPGRSSRSRWRPVRRPCAMGRRATGSTWSSRASSRYPSGASASRTWRAATASARSRSFVTCRARRP